jgi:hypothetical protein
MERPGGGNYWHGAKFGNCNGARGWDACLGNGA